MTTPNAQYKSGTPAPQDGVYVFVRHADGTTTTPPAESERIQKLSKGQLFPKVAGKDAWFELKRAT